MSEQHAPNGETETAYTISPHSDGSTYNVGIAGKDGARHTMLGFETEADAEAWVLASKARGD